MTDTTNTSTTAHLDEQAGYKQSLGRRHVQMIAIGGAIGTGLFLGSASRLHSVGPALLFSYAFAGLMAYFLMRALGELVLHRSTSGAFVSYMREFFGEKAAYVTGWMYWLNWALTGIAELSAVGVYFHKWVPSMPNWASALVALVVVLGINLLSAKAFGEFEFWASILKVTAIVIFLAVGIVVVFGAIHVGDHKAGFSNLWSNGGFWPTADPYAWYGPLLVMSGVVFAYAAIELVGVAAGEMENAEREVPRAVNSVIFRIAVFYCGSILLLICMLPTSAYKSGESPFVTVFSRLGIGWMGSVINAVLIVAAMSSLNSGLYSTGRILRSLGLSKQAPGFMTKMSSSGVPWVGIGVTSIVFVLGVILNAVAPGKAFDIALEASSLGITFTWGTIFACQLRLRQLVNRGVIPKSSFQAPGYPYTSIIGLVFLVSVIVMLAISGWLSEDKVDFYVVVVGIPVIAVVMIGGWYAIRGNVNDHTGGKLGPAWTTEDAKS
ncbi:amino acid permease [Gordonia jinhuaensis]|uniref:L-asparagine permease n=1 Tax=Gordonia jinhuaensis TaxID=1517702 RepID=A0A916T2V2_9ACTN|nr:amino acid permease [Gordonia jinhuaensis]GGB26477.1 L-asparagine permease [Gordonia jinhuaensis]